jgi:sarcosine oxidase subunit beta
MYSARGVMMLAHNVHDVQVFKRHIHANRLNGVDNEWLTPEQAKEFCPPLNISTIGALSRHGRGAATARRHRAPRRGGLGLCARGGRPGVFTSSRIARSPASAPGNGSVTGVETSRGFIGAKKVGVVAAGHTSVIMEMAGVRMPLESYPLQALVSEPVKPCFPCVVMSNTVHAYISQSDKGELVIGAGTDQYTSYSQTGGLHILSHTLDAICEMFPMFTRMKMLRSWGGIVDVTPDRSPILSKTPGQRALCQLRLGHRWLQGDTWLGACLRPYHRARRAAQDQCPIHISSGSIRAGLDRRGGGCRRGALRRSG